MWASYYYAFTSTRSYDRYGEDNIISCRCRKIVNLYIPMPRFTFVYLVMVVWHENRNVAYRIARTYLHVLRAIRLVCLDIPQKIFYVIKGYEQIPSGDAGLLHGYPVENAGIPYLVKRCIEPTIFFVVFCHYC